MKLHSTNNNAPCVIPQPLDTGGQTYYTCGFEPNEQGPNGEWFTFDYGAYGEIEGQGVPVWNKGYTGQTTSGLITIEFVYDLSHCGRRHTCSPLSRGRVISLPPVPLLILQSAL